MEPLSQKKWGSMKYSTKINNDSNNNNSDIVQKQQQKAHDLIATTLAKATEANQKVTQQQHKQQQLFDLNSGLKSVTAHTTTQTEGTFRRYHYLPSTDRYPGSNRSFAPISLFVNDYSNINNNHQQTSQSTIKHKNKPKKLISPFFDTLNLLLNSNRSTTNQNNSNYDNNKTNINEALSSIPHQQQQFHLSLSTELRKTIILILVHAGFDHTTGLVLDTLTDLLDCYLATFCALLREYTDSSDLKSSADFVDTIDKTLHHMNVPNLEALCRFHQELVQYYENVYKIKAGQNEGENEDSQVFNKLD